MFDKNYVEQVMSESIGTEHWFKRAPFQGFVYTDGVMNVQEKLNMHWFVDMVVSYIPKVIKDFKKSNKSFYIVDLEVKADHTARFTISRTLEDEEGNYIDWNVVKQNIEFTDLPECEMKFYLDLVKETPTTFCLLCPSEY